MADIAACRKCLFDDAAPRLLDLAFGKIARPKGDFQQMFPRDHVEGPPFRAVQAQRRIMAEPSRLSSLSLKVRLARRYSAAAATGAGSPDFTALRRRVRSTDSSAFAAVTERCLIGPKPRIFSGIEATATASARFCGVSVAINSSRLAT